MYITRQRKPVMFLKSNLAYCVLMVLIFYIKKAPNVLSY